MCGIAALFQSFNSGKIDDNSLNQPLKPIVQQIFEDHLEKLSNRGPDGRKTICFLSSLEDENKNEDGVDFQLFMGFTRLSINDLTSQGMQPMSDDEKSVYMICNGEIYNHKFLKKKYDLSCKSESDCEVIIELYNNLNGDIMKVLELLDGEFAFVIYDNKREKIYACRDRYGVRPMYICSDEQVIFNSKTIGFVSELKGMSYLNYGKQVTPGLVYEISLKKFQIKTYKYNDIYELPVYSINNTINPIDIYLNQIRNTFTTAVKKRVDNSERKVCCLLSGGLDSSLVAALTARHLKNKGIVEPLETFSIGIQGSPDLQYAKMVADHINSKHYSIELSESDFLEAIEDTIRTIESYDTTTVRASVGNYLVSKYIKENTTNKVVLCGDYSDEVCGGYKYFTNAPNEVEFDQECRRLVSQIHLFDSLRSDRTICSQGLEVRSPFSDPNFVECYLSIPPFFRTITSERMEKYLLRKAFDQNSELDQCNSVLLPSEVLWRRKEAFSDGVSDKSRSWHMIIKEHVNKLISDDEFECESQKYQYNRPMMKESYYYRKIFEKYYKQFENVIPYYWLPKWCGENQIDPSARELKTI